MPHPRPCTTPRCFSRLSPPRSPNPIRCQKSIQMHSSSSSSFLHFLNVKSHFPSLHSVSLSRSQTGNGNYTSLPATTLSLSLPPFPHYKFRTAHRICGKDSVTDPVHIYCNLEKYTNIHILRLYIVLHAVWSRDYKKFSFPTSLLHMSDKQQTDSNLGMGLLLVKLR